MQEIRNKNINKRGRKSGIKEERRIDILHFGGEGNTSFLIKREERRFQEFL
jgi:hypothetical protein